MTKDFTIVIPARLNSKRLPEKMLQRLGEKTLLEQTYLNALKLGAKEVIIATDSEKIAKVTKTFAARTLMTSSDHCNGTERLAELAQKLNYADDHIIVNVQGDEPFTPVQALKKIVKSLRINTNAALVTAACPIKQAEDYRNPNIVKVVSDCDNFALYFSRAGIPSNSISPNLFDTNILDAPVFRHLGLYAYRAKTLRIYRDLKRSRLELIENLEQLRFLEHGLKIYVCTLENSLPPGIDTAEDLDLAQRYLQARDLKNRAPNLE